MSQSSQVNLRRNDFRTGVILITLSVLMFLETTTYPTTESYGGVQNVWYVSPALFPYIVAVLLFLLSTVLLINAVMSIGWSEALGWKSDTDPEGAIKRLRFWAILVFIIAFIYLYVPSVDFVIGSSIFLFVFIAAFYLESRAALIAYPFAFLLAGIPLRVHAAIQSAAKTQVDRDMAGALLLLFFLVLVFMLSKNNTQANKGFMTLLSVSIFTSLILGVVFKFGLLVPLPVEGIIIETLDALRFSLFRKA